MQQEIKPWTYDACQKRLETLKAANDLEQVKPFWDNVAYPIANAVNRQKLAVALESWERMSDTWDRLEMNEWYHGLKGGLPVAGKLPAPVMDAFCDAVEESENRMESAF